jgi:GTPase SAR1 family protein
MPDTTTLDPSQAAAETEAINFDELVQKALSLFDGLGDRYAPLRRQVEDVKERLFHGEIRLAVMGQFKRGKSTFINRLLGLDVLPVSVVPVTSIPTYIRHGSETKCIIRFFSDKPDIVVRQSLPEITAALTAYATEEENPKNRLSVSEAVVECDNPLLSNGTTLIDTPGFGSTYVHNTKTTVDLVKGCDAVLFLLSADPPFTQTEVEFLKEVKRYVPRVFFIINKIDQLTAGELDKLDSFVKTVLSSELSFEADTPLFHVSARGGRDGSNAGGMARVKDEIIGFMVREKYFTLSQAVSGKLKTALDAVVKKLDGDCRELEDPLGEAQRRAAWLSQHCEQVKHKGDRELSLIEAEIKALSDYVDKTLNSKKEELHANTKSGVEKLVDAALGSRANPLATVKNAFGPLADEIIAHLFLQLATALSKPLKKAVELPYAEYIKTAEEVRTAVPSIALPHTAMKDLPVDTEMPRFTPAGPADAPAAFGGVRPPSFTLFLGREAKRGRHVEALLPAALRLIDEQFEYLSLHVKIAIRKICEACRQNLEERYRSLYDAMKAAVQETGKTDAAASEQTRGKLKLLEERKAAFAALLKQVV